ELMPRRMLMLRMRLVNRSQETVAVAGNRLHIPRTVRGIPERGPQFGHRFVQAPIEIHERMRRPEFPPYFFAGHYFPGMFQKERQNLERLFLQFDANAVLA